MIDLEGTLVTTDPLTSRNSYLDTNKQLTLRHLRKAYTVGKMLNSEGTVQGLEMAQERQHLLHKQESRSSDPQDHSRCWTPNKMAEMGNPQGKRIR